MSVHESGENVLPPIDSEQVFPHPSEAFKSQERLDALHALGMAATLEQRAYERPSYDHVPAIAVARQRVDRAIQRTMRWLLGALVVSSTLIAGDSPALAGESEAHPTVQATDDAKREHAVDQMIEQDLLRFMIDRTRFFLEREFPKNPELAQQPEFIAAFVQTQLHQYFKDEDQHSPVVQARITRLVSQITDEVTGQTPEVSNTDSDDKKPELKKE